MATDPALLGRSISLPFLGPITVGFPTRARRATRPWLRPINWAWATPLPTTHNRGAACPHYHIVAPNGQRISGHFFYGRRLPRRVLRGRPSRELEEELAQAELELEMGQSAELMARRPRTPEEEAARQRGSELVRYWIRMIGKSNRSGTPVRPQAQIQAGNQLIQEANRFPSGDLHGPAFRRYGNQLMRKGRQGLHKSQRGGRRGMREFEEQLGLAPAAYEMELERAANALQRSLEYGPVSTARPTLRRGSTGEAVRDLQSRLQRAGHNPGSIDGIFGSRTDTAVRSFQAAQSLAVDGIVGAQTWGRLLNASPGAPNSGVPSTAPVSTQVDTQLPTSGVGFYSYTSVDKRYGTAATIKALQAISVAWNTMHPGGPRIGIGDISLRGGGPFPPHSTHRDGLNADIRPVRNDNREEPVTYTDTAYSRRLTQELVDLIYANPVLSVSSILFNDSEIRGVRSATGHHNHLHVMFVSPASSR